MLRTVLQWWARQILALIPRRLLPDASGADALVVCVEPAPDAPRIHLIMHRRRREISLGRYRLDEPGLRAARVAIRSHPHRVVLRPDRGAILQRTIVLPLAAEQDVTRVLGYEMDRLTPFSAERVYWSAAIERRDRAADRLEVRLLLVPKDHLQPVLTALRRMDLEVTAIDTAGGAGVSRYIEMMPPSAARRRWIAFAWGTVAALALVAAFLPFITQSLARRAVETRMTTLGPQIAEVAALRRQIAAGKAGDDVIAAERARLGDTLQILATITDVLPDDTVLADLSVRQGKLGFSGRSLAAPRLIAAMASDPTIRNPSFVAPLTRTPDGKADTFVIRAEINP